MLAHGLQVAIQGAAGGGIFPHFVGESLVGFLEQSSRFLKPVYVGDTLYPMLEVTELKAGRTTGVAVLKLTIHKPEGRTGVRWRAQVSCEEAAAIETAGGENMIGVIAKLTIKPGTNGDFEATMKALQGEGSRRRARQQALCAAQDGRR